MDINKNNNIVDEDDNIDYEILSALFERSSKWYLNEDDEDNNDDDEISILREFGL